MRIRIKHYLYLLYSISFIFSVQFALVVYVNSSFLEEKTGKGWVGTIFTLASLLSILALLEIPRLLNRLGNYKTSLLVILGNTISLLLLGFIHSPLLIVCSFFLYNITNYSLMFSRDVYMEGYTEGGSVGETRGSLLTIVNLAWVFSPLLSGFVISKMSYQGMYLIAAMFTLPSFFLVSPWLKRFEDPAYQRVRIKETLKKIAAEKNLKKIYSSEFLLRFFYSWMIIYMPIYLHEFLGFDWKEIGIIFTAMLVPFVILDYPLGKLSDKIGEKKMLAIGFTIISLSTISIFFISSTDLVIWALIMFATRVGAATVEIMNESYFFKKIRAQDAGLISFFRNLFPLSLVISPLLATILLFFLPYKFLFFISGVILFYGIYLSFTIREIIHQ